MEPLSFLEYYTSKTAAKQNTTKIKGHLLLKLKGITGFLNWGTLKAWMSTENGLSTSLCLLSDLFLFAVIGRTNSFFLLILNSYFHMESA